MIFLTSAGFLNPMVFKLLTDNRKSAINNACIIATGMAPEKENHEVARNTKEYLMANDIVKVDFLDVEYEDPAILSNYDLIVILGGNSNHLFYHLKRSGADKYIRKHAEEGKDVVGASADAWFLGKGRQFADYFSGLVGIDETYSKIVDYNGLNLISEHIFPHYDMFADRVENLNEKISLLEKEKCINIVRLNNMDFIYKDNKGEIHKIISV